MKTILHLCADIGSDSYPYELDPEYEVIKIGKNIGVENYYPDRPIHGIIANPVCTEFTLMRESNYKTLPDMTMLKSCMQIIQDSNPVWWIVENPACGTMKDFIGKPDFTYQPWWYGSPWTKKTALWGKFNRPERKYYDWEDVPKNKNLYIRRGRTKPSLVFLHKKHIQYIPEFEPFKDKVDSDNAFRSLCSQGFAKAFKEINP